MKKSYLTLFTTIILLTLYSQQTLAHLAEQCTMEIPVHTKPILEYNSNDLSIRITAKDMVGKYPHFIEYKGNVDIQQGNQILSADKVKLTQTETTNKNPLHTVVAMGSVYYIDPQIILKGQKAWSNLNNKDTNVEKGDYLMVGHQGRGYANKVKLRGENRYIILENGMFTTCLPGKESWSIIGSKVIFDRQEEVAKIWNARFHIANTPIFYIPYLQLPIGDKRRSGFLLPNGTYSKSSGLQFAIPFYWNIATNYDTTITPQFIPFRGIKINNEFRYMTKTGSGTISIDWQRKQHKHTYIKDKNSSNKHPTPNSDNRWLLYWNHLGIFDQVWHFNIDYTKVSDSRYFTDFASKYGNSTNSYATQKFHIAYTQPNWNARLTHKQFQTFINSPNTKAYKANPQLDLNFYKYNLGPFDLKIYAQASHITSIEANNPDAIRLHIEPELNLPLINDRVSINNNVRLMATYYDQHIPERLINSTLKKHVIRVLPSVTSNVKLFFERDLLIDSNYLQTLELRMQYLYTPYCDQSDINNYDSSLLQTDYNGLFRNKIYSGLDRITSDNQLTTGITTRIYDEELIERFNFSIGQTYYFEQNRTKDKDSNLQIKDKSNNTGQLLLVGDTYLRLTDNLGVRGWFQYDRQLGDITMWNIVTEYCLDSNHLIQLNYRFIDRDYIQATVRNAPTAVFQKGISQMGVIISWPLSNRLGCVGSYYHDLKENQAASRLIGVQYSTCCWSINMGYGSKIIGLQEQTFNSSYDNYWSINIEIRGLNNNYNFESQDMLTTSILPYQRAF